MKYVQQHVLKKTLCALQVFLFALISRPLCARTCAQHRRNIAYDSMHSCIAQLIPKLTIFSNFRRYQPTPGKSSGDPCGGRDPLVENR